MKTLEEQDQASKLTSGIEAFVPSARSFCMAQIDAVRCARVGKRGLNMSHKVDRVSLHTSSHVYLRIS
jgi:hypothetical protein